MFIFKLHEQQGRSRKDLKCCFSKQVIILFSDKNNTSIEEEHNSYILNDIKELRSLAQSILERPKKSRCSRIRGGVFCFK